MYHATAAGVAVSLLATSDPNTFMQDAFRPSALQLMLRAIMAEHILLLMPEKRSVANPMSTV